MSIKIKNGNILNATEDIIVHQVNGLGIMGGGLAKQIRNKYPNVYRTYRKYAKSHDDPTDLLGRNLMITPDGEIMKNHLPVEPNHQPDKIIANVFGQAYIGTSEKQTDEKALTNAIVDVALFASVNNLTVAIPYGIGCGLGGGDWNVIREIIETAFDLNNNTDSVVLYKYQ